MRMRFVVTHVNARGLRVLSWGNQGRNHCDTREEAQQKLDLFKPGWVENGILTPKQAETLQVTEVECYDHGDAVRTVFGIEDDSAETVDPDEVDPERKW